MDAPTRRLGWGWPWWLLALGLLAFGVLVGYKIVPRRQPPPVMHAVVASGTASLKPGSDSFAALLNDNYRYEQRVGLADDSKERIFPVAWNGKDLEASVELTIPPCKRATIAFDEFDGVQEAVNGGWAAVRPSQRFEHAFRFLVDTQPGNHSFRGLFRTASRSGFATNTLLVVYLHGDKPQSPTYRIAVQPVE